MFHIYFYSDVLLMEFSYSVFVFVSMQYYYNPHTQQYMYWDGENHTYTPATTEQASAEGAPLSTAPPDSLRTSPSNKEKKDKPKSKTAQQVNMSHISTEIHAVHTKLNFKLLGISMGLLTDIYFLSDCQRHGALGQKPQQAEGEHALCVFVISSQLSPTSSWVHQSPRPRSRPQRVCQC